MYTDPATCLCVWACHDGTEIDVSCATKTRHGPLASDVPAPGPVPANWCKLTNRWLAGSLE
jgi:hypothetical protein